MKTLTKAQEDLMHYVWELGECTVGDLRKAIEAREGKKPAHSTVSTLVLALDDRGFVSHREYGRTFVYTPTLTREAYGRQRLSRLVSSFFGGSPSTAIAHLVDDQKMSLRELNALVRKLEEE